MYNAIKNEYKVFRIKETPIDYAVYVVNLLLEDTADLLLEDNKFMALEAAST